LTRPKEVNAVGKKRVVEKRNKGGGGRGTDLRKESPGRTVGGNESVFDQIPIHLEISIRMAAKGPPDEPG